MNLIVFVLFSKLEYEFCAVNVSTSGESWLEAQEEALGLVIYMFEYRTAVSALSSFC